MAHTNSMSGIKGGAPKKPPRHKKTALTPIDEDKTTDLNRVSARSSYRLKFRKAVWPLYLSGYKQDNINNLPCAENGGKRKHQDLVVYDIPIDNPPNKEKSEKDTVDNSLDKNSNFPLYKPKYPVSCYLPDLPHTGSESPRTGSESPQKGSESPHTRSESPRTGSEPQSQINSSEKIGTGKTIINKMLTKESFETKADFRKSFDIIYDDCPSESGVNILISFVNVNSWLINVMKLK